MKKLLFMLLCGLIILGLVGCNNEVKEACEIKDGMYTVDDWKWEYQSDNSTGIACLGERPRVGTEFLWTFPLLEFEIRDGKYVRRDLSDVGYKDIVIENLDKIITNKFIDDVQIKPDHDFFLAVFEVTKVTNNRIYAKVNKIVYLGTIYDENLIEIYQ